MQAAVGARTLATALAACGFVALLVSLDATAANTKTDEGIATRKGSTHYATGADRATRARAGDDAFYWIEWQEPPTGKEIRCVLKKDGPEGETLYDDTQPLKEAVEETYTTCGMEGDSDDEGTFYFIQYIDGEKVGERGIIIDKASFWGGLSLRRKWKYLTGGLGGIILVIYWVRRKMGMGNEIDAVMGSKPEAKMAGAGVVIGSRLKDPAPVAEPAPAPKPTAEASLDAFKKRLAVDPAAKIVQAEDVIPIATAARAAGDSKTAIAAVRGFDKAFPGHALIPDVFVFTAKMMAEDLKNTDMARKILEHVIAKYPGHYLAQDARRYLQATA